MKSDLDNMKLVEVGGSGRKMKPNEVGILVKMRRMETYLGQEICLCSIAMNGFDCGWEGQSACSNGKLA